MSEQRLCYKRYIAAVRRSMAEPRTIPYNAEGAAPMDFDFPLLKQEIKTAAMQAFEEMNKTCQDDRVIAFA
ncbi:hypothetical protein P4V64_15255 [Bacillus thuringiensis]|nr:hypothetical protein [Bacillus thuringiensis]